MSMETEASSKALMIYYNNREVLAALSDAERGKLLMSLLDYSENGVVPDYTGVLQMAFVVLRRDVDNNNRRWEEICKRRSEGGKKSAATRAAKKFQCEVSCDNSDGRSIDDASELARDGADHPSAGGSGRALGGVGGDCDGGKTVEDTREKIKTVEDTCENVKTVEDTCHFATYTNTNTNSSSPSQSPGGRGREFETFWLAYPRKVGKKAARKAFEQTDVPLDRILEALERQREDPQWNREKGRFIPHPATWLNQGRWDDEPPAPAASVRDWSCAGIETL